jgi:hypothetical protein
MQNGKKFKPGNFSGGGIGGSGSSGSGGKTKMARITIGSVQFTPKGCRQYMALRPPTL